MDLNSLLLTSRMIRQELVRSGKANAFRLVHGAADGVRGLVVEQWADVLVAQIFPDQLQVSDSVLRSSLEKLCVDVNARAVYRKTFVTDRSHVPAEIAAMHGSPHPWIGQPVEPEITIRENGLKFKIRPYDGFSVGLFLENRDNRQRVRGLAGGRRVLNAFSYTCAFSVAAAAGGAQSVASVDLSRRYLEWGKQNFEVSDLPTTGHMFFCSDIFEFYRRAQRQQRRFDLIILDAPTFGRVRRPQRTFVLEHELNPLLAGALQLLDPGGLMLLGTNARQLSLERLEQEMRIAAAPRTCRILERPALPPDFHGDPDYSKTVIARFD